MTGRAELVIAGGVVLAAHPDRLETAEAIGIAGKRVVAAGDRRDVLAAAAPGARVIDVGRAAVIPGLHDFHVHLIGLARSRRGVSLDGAVDGAEVARRVERAIGDLPPGAWLRGRGWSEATFGPATLSRVVRAVGARPALLGSHDGHSAWASPAALARAGIGPASPDPPGGRIERDASGAPTGILRETALEPLTAVAAVLSPAEMATALDELLAELASHGITGATDAGDADDRGGFGEYAALGDSFSTATSLAAHLDGRLRLTSNIPGSAIRAAAGLGLRTGEALAESATLRMGWAKSYADGALGSRTAALFEPYACADGRGILRLDAAALDGLLHGGRAAGIGAAVHAIGDRALATVLDAFERAGPRPAGIPPDRIEHVQLLRAADRPRLVALDLTASMQPIHAAADRDAVDRCWAGRQEDAYAWRSLALAGARLAFGSDAPVESVNPWWGIFAATRRHLPGDGRSSWRVAEALSISAALAGYTLGPALAAGRSDEGHLRPGALADLAVLDIGMAELGGGDERLAGARSQLTLVGGREVPRQI